MVDTVEALGNGPLDDGIASSLRALWEQAHGERERLRAVRVLDGEDVAHATRELGPALDVIPAGRGAPYPLMLVGPHWSLQVSPWTGNAKCILRASYLASASRADVVREVERIADCLWRGQARFRLSRLDIAADCVGLEMEPFARLSECVARTTRATIHADGEPVEGERARLALAHGIVETVTHGSASSTLQLCIYDKTREMKSSGKGWQADDLRARGWDGVSTVVRVEARFRSRAFDEFPSRDLRDVSTLLALDTVAPELWAYATRAVRYVEPDAGDTNRARWEMRDDWRMVASLGTIALERTRIVSEAVREERLKRAAKSALSGFVTFAASDERLARRVCERTLTCAAEGQAPELGLIAEVFAAVGDLLGVRAIEARNHLERAQRINDRVRERARFSAWADNHAGPMRLAAA